MKKEKIITGTEKKYWEDVIDIYIWLLSIIGLMILIGLVYMLVNGFEEQLSILNCWTQENLGKLLVLVVIFLTSLTSIIRRSWKSLFIGIPISFILGGVVGITPIFFSAGTASKPAIYIYPKKEINVEVKLKIKGQLMTVIPDYNDGWRMHVKPNGQMKVIGGNTQISYDYIYYDNTVDKIIKPKEGWNIHKKDLLKWHKKFLTDIGLNESEKKEYLEYWIPRLENEIDGDYILINNLSKDYIDEYMELNITPKPEHIYRLLVLYRNGFKNMEIKNPEVETFERKGYYVVEWGGILN